MNFYLMFFSCYFVLRATESIQTSEQYTATRGISVRSYSYNMKHNPIAQPLRK